jgi:hypothetical protein
VPYRAEMSELINACHTLVREKGDEAAKRTACRTIETLLAPLAARRHFHSASSL